MTRFNLVDKFGRLAVGRDQIEPAARDHEASGQSQNAVSDRVAMVMIIEKPRVDVALAQGLLDGFEVHGQRVILHDQLHWLVWCRCGTESSPRSGVQRPAATSVVIKITVNAR